MRRAFRGPGRVQASGLEAPIHPPRGPFGAPTRAPVPSQAVAAALGKRRLFVHLPVPLARLQARLFNLLPGKPPLTEDQVTMLGEDNVCDPGPMKRAFGFEPRSLEDYLKERFGGR